MGYLLDMKCFSLFFLLFFAAVPTFAQSFQMLPQADGDVPPGMRVEGKVIAQKRWRDRNGINQLVLTETGVLPDHCAGTDDPCRQASLHAYQWTRSAAGRPWRLSWQLRDFVTECPLDINVAFVPDSLTVTDLNRNGVGEVTMIYRTACRGDVSPSTMKLIVREMATKYAIRGTGRIRMGGSSYGGERHIDPTFSRDPALRRYALKRWDTFVNESLGSP